MNNIIQINGLKKYFSCSSNLFGLNPRQIKAVDDVSLSIKEGEIMGLVGESGSGKTTLARVILGLTKSTEGSVLMDDIDMLKMNRQEMKKIRREVAVIFQDPGSNLNPRQTVESSIMRPLLIHGVSRKEAKERAIEALSLVKMDQRYLMSYPHQLSGGQQQRIAIARALVCRPKIMILDEPTSALDVSVQAQILNLLLDLQERLGLTYLVISHDLNVIRYICDKVAVMYLGKLVEYGPTEAIIDEPAHPYTIGLMAASPILNPKERGIKKKGILSGDPGSLKSLGDGCRFAPRCSHSSEKCKREAPQMVERSEDHFTSCFLFAQEDKKNQDNGE